MIQYLILNITNSLDPIARPGLHCPLSMAAGADRSEVQELYREASEGMKIKPKVKGKINKRDADAPVAPSPPTQKLLLQWASYTL